MDFYSIFLGSTPRWGANLILAGVAELVYAVDLKSTVREELGVRIPSPAPKYAVQVSVTSIEKDIFIQVKMFHCHTLLLCVLIFVLILIILIFIKYTIDTQ